MTQSFEKTAVGLDHKVPGYLIRCGGCRTVEKLSAASQSGSMSPEMMARRFTNQGWAVGSQAKANRCPKCISKEQIERRNKANLKLVEGKAMIIPARAEEPREMTKEDRRIIFAKIDEYYIDESTGYKPGWTDSKIAADLNVPLGWARQIREENFGKEGGNDEIRGLLTQAQTCVSDIKEKMRLMEGARSALNIFDDRLRKIEAEGQSFLLHATRIEGHIARIEKALK